MNGPAQQSISAALQQATRLIAAGRLADAEALYRDVLAQQPLNHQSLSHLGLIALHRRDFPSAVRFLNKALMVKPHDPDGQASLAMALQECGRWNDAAAAFSKAIAMRPDQAAFHYNLAVCLEKAGHGNEAIAAYHAAIAKQPDLAPAYTNLGIALLEAGQAENATGVLQQSLTLRPDNALAWYNLGLALRSREEPIAAERAYVRALRLHPDFAEALTNMGILLVDQGRPDDAVTVFRRALALKPGDTKAFINLGEACRVGGNWTAATRAFCRAITLQPEEADLWNSLGITLLSGHDDEPCRTAFENAVCLDPSHAEALSNLGHSLYRAGNFGRSVREANRALMLKPEFAGAHNNLGVALQAAGQVDAAVGAYRAALAIRPDHPPAWYNLATALLLRGDFEEGWNAYEWRWKGGVPCLSPRPLAAPEWIGDAPAGRRILVHAEQGIGDAIQFARYLPLLAARGARVLVECHPELISLFKSLQGIESIASPGETPPPHDLQLPMMSLPQRFATLADGIPADIPYLFADPEASQIWAERLAPLRGKKVGLVWAGNARDHDAAAHAVDRRRSLPLSLLAPLLALPDIAFISLQKGPAAGQIVSLPPPLRPSDPTSGLADFADTAALVANLDLVISVDTAVAHLAGAMGKPVWILSRFDGCWRWLLDRDDSPWYPTARLFRQTKAGDWHEVAGRVAAALSAWSALP
jgi:Flp pilus assembly protein TadD